LNFVFIDQVFPDITVNLRVLSRGTERYRLALYQHEGILALTNNDTKLGNIDNPGEKLRAFLSLSREKNADLAMTPEYSCPWEVINEIIEDQELWPNEGKLWALGAESITPNSISELSTRYHGSNIAVHFDQSHLTDNGVFFDPLVYIFRATIRNEPRLIVLIQFKTHHMGVWGGGELERNRLIEGSEICILRNGPGSVNLLSVICSEAMNFPTDLSVAKRAAIGWDDLPFLVLNPQVNPDPLHDRFINFRNFVFDQERKEIIGLNWNLSSKIGTNDLLRGGTSRGGIYMNSNEVNFSDKKRIRQNHKLGLYYFYFGKSRHAFILNSKPHIYIIEQLSVHITEGVHQQRLRNGPELIESYSHQPDGTLVVNVSVSDDHLDCFASLGCRNDFLTNADNCVLEKERLACLSSASFLTNNVEGWAGVDKLFSFRLQEATEINNRITYTEDSSTVNQRQRQHYITAVNELDGVLLPNKQIYPECIADLKGFPVLLAYAQETDVNHVKYIEREKYRYNLINQYGSMVRATVCNLGLASLKDATKTFESIQSIFETDNMNRQRIVVFYKEGLTQTMVADGHAGRIVITENDKGQSSFLNTP
jgi:hypothetical protein